MLADDTKDDVDRISQSVDFHELVRLTIIAELRVMIKRLQSAGDFRLPDSVNFDDIDLRTARYLKEQLRDTLRTLGGGR